VKPWRLTPQAEQSLAEIAAWTVDRFGQIQALRYRDALITRINAFATGEAPHARPCSVLMQAPPGADSLTYYREGGHFIIM